MIDLEYLAGLFDAEGSVGLYRGKRSSDLRFCASIVNTDLEALRLVEGAFGGRVSKLVSWKQKRVCWKWISEGPSCIKFLAVLLPHLIQKREQARLTIQARGLVHRNGVKLTKRDLTARERYKRKIASLKRAVCHIPCSPPPAYVAGFFDGEGCIYIATPKSGYTHLRASAYNTDRGILDYLKGVYGGTVKRGMKRAGHERRPCFQWEVSGDRAFRFLSVHVANMEIKRKQARLALEFHGLKTAAKEAEKPLRGFGSEHKRRISNLNRGVVSIPS